MLRTTVYTIVAALFVVAVSPSWAQSCAPNLGSVVDQLEFDPKSA